MHFFMHVCEWNVSWKVLEKRIFEFWKTLEFGLCTSWKILEKSILISVRTLYNPMGHYFRATSILTAVFQVFPHLIPEEDLW